MKAYIHTNRQLWRGHEDLHTQTDNCGEVMKTYIHKQTTVERS